MQKNMEKAYYVLVLLKWEEPTRVQQIPHNRLEASVGSEGPVKLHHLHSLESVDGCATIHSGITAPLWWDTFTGK